jgi:hypothetical protein
MVSSVTSEPEELLGELRPVFDPEAKKWRVTRTGRAEDGRYSFNSESDASDWVERATGRPMSVKGDSSHQS